MEEEKIEEQTAELEQNKNNEKESGKSKKERQKKFKDGINTFFTDFKKFISKGNIIDLSVAVVIGAAFNKIVSSLVNNIIMPLISLTTGGVSVSDWKWVIKPATYDSANNLITAENALSYGIFIQAIIDFLLIAFTIFVILKIMVNSERGIKTFKNKIKKGKNISEETKEEEIPVPAKIESQEDILKDIRTLLQNSANIETQEKIETEE